MVSAGARDRELQPAARDALPRPWRVGLTPVPIRLASGELALAASAAPRGTTLRTVRQRAPLRSLRVTGPRGEPSTAVVVNTAGGVVSGDTLMFEAAAGVGTSVRVCGQAADKVYRSSTADTEAQLDVRLRVDAGAWLEYVPQGTVVFDGGRVRQRTVLDVDAEGAALVGGLFTLGRVARGKAFRSGRILDEWHVIRAGRFAWADALRFDGGGVNDLADLAASVADPTRATTVGTMLLAKRDAAMLVDPLREVAEIVADGVRWGVTSRDGLLVARLLGEGEAEVRHAFAALWSWLRAEAGGWPPALPSLWNG